MRHAKIAGSPRLARQISRGMSLLKLGIDKIKPKPTRPIARRTIFDCNPAMNRATPVLRRIACGSRVFFACARICESLLAINEPIALIANTAVPNASGMMPIKTQRQLKALVMYPARPGAIKLGKTHPAEIQAKMRDRLSSGHTRLMMTKVMGANPPAPAPWKTRPIKTRGIDVATDAMSNPMRKILMQPMNGARGPRRSACSLAATSPMMSANMYAAKVAPYR